MMPEYKIICPHCGKPFALSEYAYHTFVHKLDLKLLICSECGNRIEDWYSRIVTMPDYVKERENDNEKRTAD